MYYIVYYLVHIFDVLKPLSLLVKLEDLFERESDPNAMTDMDDSNKYESGTIKNEEGNFTGKKFF